MEVEFVERTPIGRGRYTVVTGFAGPGFIANTAVMYIVRQRGFELKAHLRSPLMPPMMLLIDGRPIPAFRVYGGDDLLLVVSEVFPPSEGAWRIGHHLFDWLMGKGASEFISVESSLRPFRGVVGFTTEGRRLLEVGVRPTGEGAVTGINACLLEGCMERGIPWTSLFIPAATVSSVDYDGAAAAVEILDRMFKLDVDATPLRKMAEALRKGAKRRGFLGRLRGE